MLRHLALSVSILFAGVPLMSPAARAQDDAPTLWAIVRIQGFRPQEVMTVRSDYRFEVTAEGNFTYRPFGPKQDPPYLRTGKLSVPIEEFESRMAATGWEEIPIPDPNAPQVADRPEISVLHDDGNGEPRRRTARLNHPAAIAIDRLIGELLMGIIEIDLKANPLSDSIEFGQPLEPTLITDLQTLKQAFAEPTEELTDSIDFDQQQVLVFRWKGSGGDELFGHREADGQDPQVTIAYRRGRTRDLREHQRAMVIPRGIDWRVVTMKPIGAR